MDINNLTMKEETVVRNNLMTDLNYTPYCGGNKCNYISPKSVWNSDKKQFTCKCGWVSQFPDEFIDRYVGKWDK